MARDTIIIPRQLPASASDFSVVSDLNSHVTFIGEEFVLTLIVPLPAQFPSRLSRKAASSLTAAEGEEDRTTNATNLKRYFFMHLLTFGEC